MLKLLYSQAAIASRLDDLASAIRKDLGDVKLIHTIVTMNGSMMFAADLTRVLGIPQILHFTGGSYFKGAIKHEVALNPETLPTTFGGAPVLILEDILDNGTVIKQLRQLAVERQAGKVLSAALFKRMGSESTADHVAFTLPKDSFVVGYGLDMDGRYRELKDIHCLDTGIASNKPGLC
ncbi:MAG: hypothetical protein COY40_03405 [Alphaproteobacteria bacterium CG_4_10_14_0_8_um_filter_53_9]|nr:MAG: hypothetical protein COY40_03405 [Alphaproteobacteria bacterium CG_4_10_14_0_8_um_filter_53_9]